MTNSLPMKKEVLIEFEVEDRACAVSLSPAIVPLARVRNGVALLKFIYTTCWVFRPKDHS